jgi:energy-converting hydrogenase Eha subunit F
MEGFAFFLQVNKFFKKKKLFIPLWRRGDMRVKKLLSLLTLVFLILFLIVSAFPNDGTNPKPDPDADPWNETGCAPYDEGGTTIIIITIGYLPSTPYFTFTAVKISKSDAPVIAKESKSTRSHSRSKVSI